jgi:hypothetical protein
VAAAPSRSWYHVAGGRQDPINVAYTTEGLTFHMDLAYYESPPGIQMLVGRRGATPCAVPRGAYALTR